MRIKAFLKEGGVSCWILCKCIDKGSGLDYTLETTNRKHPLRHMSKKMKANKEKVEEKSWKWMIDRRKSIGNRGLYTVQSKSGIH